MSICSQCVHVKRASRHPALLSRTTPSAACVTNLDLIMNRKKQRTVRFRRVRFSMRLSAVTSGCGEPKRFARSANAHLNDDETVAKMGHPILVARLDVGHPSCHYILSA